MKGKIKKFLALLSMVLSLMITSVIPVSAAGGTPDIWYRSHCQNIGWQGAVCNGALSGTVAQSLRLEAVQAAISGMSGGINYRTHCQNIGWTPWTGNGITSGTENQSLRVEAVEFYLTGTIAQYYDVFYRTHCEAIGWTPWVANGATSGTVGQSLRVEGLEMKLVPKASVNSSNSSAESSITSRLQNMMNGSYANNTYKLNTTYTGLYANEQCKGFAKRVHQILFGFNIGSTKTNKYEININQSNSIKVGTLTSLSATSLRNLFNQAKAGDFIQLKRSHGGPHSMIYLSSDTNGVTVYECNVDKPNGIIKRTYSWQQFCSANAAVSVYTARDYRLH